MSTQKSIFCLMRSHHNMKSFNLADFLNFLADEKIRRLVVEIAYLRVAEESSTREIQDLLAVISKSGLADKIIEKKQLAARANNVAGNKVLELELTIEIINLTRQLNKSQIAT